MRKIFLLILLCALPSLARAAGGACPTVAGYYNAAGTSLVTLSSLGITNCYYISISGSDTNAGTTEAAPLAHMPGMPGCASNCSSASTIAGTGYIFRGAETWTSASFPITWTHSGTSANPIYIGVDQGWHAGGAWSRPVWTCPAGCYAQGGNQYITLDNFEATGMLQDWTAGAEKEFTVFNMCPTSTGSYNIVENTYTHGWNLVNGATLQNKISVIFGSLCGENITGFQLRYNVVDGSDCTGACNSSAGGMVIALYNGATQAYGNYFTHYQTGLDGCGDAWHDNVMDAQVLSLGSGTHQDSMYHVMQCTTAHSLIYNNVIRNTNYSGSGGAVKLWLNGNGPCPFGNDPTSCVSYAFNNVIYNNSPGEILDTGGHNAINYGTWNIFNNTINCGTDTVAGGCSVGDGGDDGGLSTSSNTLGTGTKTFIVTSPKPLSFMATGYPSLAYPNGNPSIWMYGTVTSCLDSSPTPTACSSQGAGTVSPFTVIVNFTSTSATGVGNSYNSWSVGGAMTLNLFNNHWITTDSPPTGVFKGRGGEVGSCNRYICSATNDLYQTVAQAKANITPHFDQYTGSQTYGESPVANTNSTVNAGTNESTLCTAVTSVNAAAGTACSSGTGYACSYNSTNHSVSCPGLTPVARGSTWDIGAYEFGTSQSIVATPTFNPPGGSYGSAQTVTISSTTAGSSFLYCQDTTNLCVPATSGSSVSVSGTGYLRAIATNSGYQNSSVASGFYQIGIVGNASQTSLDTGDANYVFWTPFTVFAGSGGYTIGSLLLYVGTPAASNWGTALYSDASGSPGSLLCSRIASTTPIAGWNTLTPSGCGTLTNGVQYWLAQITGSNAQSQGFTAGNCPNGSNSPFSTLQSSTAFPSTGGSVTFTGNCYSEYAMLTPATGSNPIAALGPTAFSFSTNNNTTSASQTTTLQNIGNANLTVTADGTTTMFTDTQSGTCPPVPYTLTPSQACTYTLVFSPTATGLASGTFSVTDNSGGTPGSVQTVALSGTGTAPVFSWAPSSFAFGNVSTTSPATSTVLVGSNTGNGPTTGVLSYSDSHFTTSSTTCGASITAGGSCNVQVRFAPTAATGYSANLIWTDSSGIITPVNLALTGSGVVNQVATPLLSVPGGTYNTTQTVTITDSTGGAAICYRLDGGIPTATTPGTCDGAPTQTYSSPLAVNTSQTISAIGTLTGDSNSAATSASYNLIVATPVFALTSGTPPNPPLVYSITSATPSTVIWYTTNGIPPVCGSFGGVLANGGTLRVSSSQTLQAIGCVSGFVPSPVVTQQVLIRGLAVTATPTKVPLL